ncbi:hypothetical protein OHA21_51465 [Actinoplanes sp. NBC_00393]|uniref:hypothetical protein n=1 Tax=Actinoplanes sp. NBC_00393 TaxID=2975953 RepID=UPI002E20324C
MADVLAVVREMEPGWLVVALAAQVLSQVAFAQQQRVLLAALGVRVAGREMLAITYSRSAISMALPAGWSPGASRGCARDASGRQSRRPARLRPVIGHGPSGTPY